MIKNAKKCESERWKTIREEVLVEMDKEIKGNMRKIQKDLLGQELGDLKSCVMKFLDVSPVDAFNEIFRFLCIFTSASFRIEILVFRIRICDVTLSSNERFHLEFCGRLCWIMVALLTIKWLIRVEKVN